MGLFSYIRTSKNEKRIQTLLDEIGCIFYNVEIVENKNIKLFSASEIMSFNYDLCRIVDKVREIESICDSGDRQILRATRYDNRWFPRRTLGVIIKKILETVISCRSHLNEPAIYQEEYDVFMRYNF